VVVVGLDGAGVVCGATCRLADKLCSSVSVRSVSRSVMWVVLTATSYVCLGFDGFEYRVTCL